MYAIRSYYEKSLNKEQLQAVSKEARHIVVSAGPGTGKTFTLVSKIERLLRENLAQAQDITAITFTNRAAEEMKERLGLLSGVEIGKLFVGTFHAFCLQILREQDKELAVVGEEQRNKIIKKLFHRITSYNVCYTKLLRFQPELAFSLSAGP